MYILLMLFVIMLNIDFYEFFVVNKYFYLLGKKTQKMLDKQDSRQHNRDCKALRKEIRKYVDKNFGPWGDGTLTFLEIQIRYWVKYYSLGWNVQAMEYEEAKRQGYFPKDNKGEIIPTRLEIAKHLQILLYRYWDFGFGLTDEELIEYETNPIAFPNGLFKNRMKSFHDKYNFINEDGIEDFDDKKYNEDYLKCKQELFEYYMKYNDFMWD